MKGERLEISSFSLPYKRVLLTGGSGFVGRHLSPMIAAATPQAERLAIHRSRAEEAMSGWDVEEVEIFDVDRIRSIVQRFQPDAVVHMAAQASVGQSHVAAESTWHINFGGTFALARAVAEYAPHCVFLFTSSAEVYGLSLRDGPVGEDATLRPVNCYARSKAACEQVLADVLPKECRLVITRAFNHLGAGQDERFVMASLAAQIARIEAGLQPPSLLVGNLDAARDFLDVRDVCEAYMHLLSIAPSLSHSSVFNISSGLASRVGDVLAMLKSVANTPFSIEIDPARLRPNEIPCAVGLNDKLVAATPWRPRRRLADTLSDLLQGARAGVRAAGAQA